VLYRFSRQFIAVAMVLAAPAVLAAQQQAAPPQLTPELQAMVVELQQLQGRLLPIQQQAMQDSELRSEQEAIAQIVQAAIAEEPALADIERRAADLQTRAEAAQQAGNEAQLQQVAIEVQQLQQQVMSAQAQVFERPEIAARAEAFQSRLQARMIEIDPEVEPMIQRYAEIERRLAAELGQ
jgi:hypothetical protein